MRFNIGIIYTNSAFGISQVVLLWYISPQNEHYMCLSLKNEYYIDRVTNDFGMKQNLTAIYKYKQNMVTSIYFKFNVKPLVPQQTQFQSLLLG